MNEEKISLPCFVAFLGINHTSIAQASWKITFKMIQKIILSVFLNNASLTTKKTVVNHDGFFTAQTRSILISGFDALQLLFQVALKLDLTAFAYV